MVASAQQRVRKLEDENYVLKQQLAKLQVAMRKLKVVFKMKTGNSPTERDLEGASTSLDTDQDPRVKLFERKKSEALEAEVMVLRKELRTSVSRQAEQLAELHEMKERVKELEEMRKVEVASPIPFGYYTHKPQSESPPESLGKLVDFALDEGRYLRSNKSSEKPRTRWASKKNGELKLSRTEEGDSVSKEDFEYVCSELTRLQQRIEVLSIRQNNQGDILPARGSSSDSNWYSTDIRNKRKQSIRRPKSAAAVQQSKIASLLSSGLSTSHSSFQNHCLSTGRDPFVMS